jgi:hypothetical protein
LLFNFLFSPFPSKIGIRSYWIVFSTLYIPKIKEISERDVPRREKRQTQAKLGLGHWVKFF